MARFIDKNGYWVDSDEVENKALKSYYEDLVPTMNPSENPLSGWNRTQPLDQSQIDEVMIKQRGEAAAIDTYTAQFKPVAQTPAGEDALKKVLSDQTAPKEQRAGAAQALYPGMKAGIGANGEMSFSAAAGASLGFNYPDQVKTKEAKANRIAGAPADLENFDQQFRAIQAMDDPNEIANAYAALNASANNYIVAKSEAAKATIGTALGLNTYEKQMETDRLLDQQYYDQYTGGQNYGPTTESQLTIQAFQNTRAERDRQVEETLGQDETIVQIRTKLKVMENLVSTRLGETLSTDTSTFVDDALVASALLVEGADPSKATPAQLQKIKQQIDSGDPQMAFKIQIAQAPLSQQLTVAATSPGREGTWALNGAKSNFDTPEIAEQLITEFKQFDTKYLDAIPENRRSEYQLSVVAQAGSAAAQKQAKAEVDNARMAFIINKYQESRKIGFEQSIDQWAPPQNSLIQDELKATLTAIKTAKQRVDDMAPIFIDEIVGRFNWDGQDATVKAQALAEYISSQAGATTDQKAFGPIPLYNDKDSVLGLINAKIASSRYSDRMMTKPQYQFAPL